MTESIHPRKRRRVITACVECHRRKQKCDRQSPCNVCIARKVEDKCSYDHDSQSFKKSPSEEKVPAVTGKEIREEEDEQTLQVPKSVDLSDQTGYSSRTDSNVLVGLQKSLTGSNNGHLTSNSKPSGSMLMAYLKEKFCKIVSELPAEPRLTEILDHFFTEANAHTEILEMYYFNKLFAKWRIMNESMSKKARLEGASRELLYFPALVFQSLAVGLQYLPLKSPTAAALGLHDWKSLDDLSERYSEHGLRLMNLLGRHSSTVTAVQHDLVRALWLKNCSRGTESWYTLGDAIRQAQDLGLHLQSEILQSQNIEETLERLWYDEFKRRLWVSLFNWDAHMALVLGRPRTINASDCTIKTPLDCNMPEIPSKTVPATTGPNDKPSTFTRHWYQYQLSHKIHEMLSLGADKRYVKDYKVVTTLHYDVLALLDTLPPVVRPKNTDHSWDVKCPYIKCQREHVLTATYSFLTALHRPHAAVHVESRDAAVDAALTVLDSQQRLFNIMESNHHRTFGLSFYTLDAAMYLCAAVIEYPTHDEHLMGRIYSAIEDAIVRLNSMVQRSPMAESGVNLLKRCYETVQSNRSHNTSSTNGIGKQDVSFQPQSTDFSSPIYSSEHESKSEIELITQPDTFAWSPAFGYDFGDATSFDTIGNVTDFNAAFWTGQMSQILNANTGVPNDDVTWDEFFAP